MKKSLIALAALAATSAFAQSSVTVSGTFDPSIATSSTTYNGGKVNNNFIRNNSQGTSQITFRGVEDLGGGLKASFLFENDFDTRYDANGPMGNTAAGSKGVNIGSGGGEQFLALEGGFGKVQLGAANTPTLTAQASRQPFSTKIGGGFNGVTGTGHVRSNNSVVYTSPAFSGFNVAVGYGFNQNANAFGAAALAAETNSGQATTQTSTVAEMASITDIGAFYANGPVSAGVSMWTTASTAVPASVKTEQTNAFVSYDLGVARLIAGYHTEKKVGSIDATGYNLAAVVPLSASLNLLANYGQLDSKLTTNLDKKITAIGLKYSMSKMTSVYARYVDEKNDNVTSATSAKSVQTTLVGMQTNF